MKMLEPKGKYRVMAEINMIPLIDVSLVLLIIFMVITPALVRSQIKIKLPTSTSADLVTTAKDALDVQITKDGAIFIEGQSVAPAAVEATLRQRLHDPQNQPVVIQADKEVPFQHVVAVMSAAKRIGAASLGVGVRQDQDQKTRKRANGK